MSDTPRSPDLGPHRHLPESHLLRRPFAADEELVLTGADLSIADVESVARAGRRVSLGDEARARVVEARAVVPDEPHRFTVAHALADFDARGRVLAGELPRVVEQIAQDLFQQAPVAFGP